MPSAVANKFRIHNAQQFKEAFDETSNTTIYFYIGGPSPFTNDSSPPVPILTTANIEYTPWDDMIAMKRVQASEVSHVIPRYNWTANTVYTAYDDKTTTLITDQFYVINDEYDVFKCLDNNNGIQSTYKPTKPIGSVTSPFTTSDGYLWKYMYHVTTGDALKFLTTNYMPVKYLESDDSSDQWDVQQAAVDGAIHKIKVTSGGTGYVSAPTVTILGDGSGANATAVLSGNSVSSITMNNIGSGYTRAVVSFSGGSGANAAATAIISPKGGHGSNPVEELAGIYVLVNTRLDGTESSTFSVGNEFRKIGLIRDPYLYGTSNRAYGSVYRQTFRYTLSSATGTFAVDETATSGSNTATVVEWDSSNNHLYCTSPTPEYFANTTSVSTDSGTGTIISISTPGIQPYSGDILYVENRSPIHRAADQIEDVKLIVEF